MIQFDNELIIQADALDVINILKSDLAHNGIERFNTIKLTGDNIQVNCPFHKGGKEHKPSFGINIHNGKCNCFACSWRGDLRDMISEIFGNNDMGKFGTNWLIKHFNTLEVENRPTISFDRRRAAESKLEYVSEEELDSYRYIHPYMYKRGLTDEIIELFDIGYDAKTECITFPVRDIKGNTLFIARRSVNSKYFNYPSGAEKPLYGLYELTHSFLNSGRRTGHNEIIICESMLDALSCWVYGSYAVAMNGVGSERVFREISMLPVRKIVLATDKDQAGQKAREILRKKITNKIIMEFDYRSYPEHAKDINDMSKEEFLKLRKIF